MKKIGVLLFCLFAFTFAYAQQSLSSEAEINVLTVGPGTSLNDSFGHSGFRIKDETNQLDLVFNYGVYDFDTPNFYLKFAQGKLNYLIGVNYFDDFFTSYMSQNRTIQEQVLNISLEQKQQLFDYLLNNYKPANRAYLYDFFYDNCATRIRDVLEDVMDNNVTFHSPDEFQAKSFRQLIQENLNKNSWGSLGIDIALGSVIDKKATAYEYMYLPKFIYVFFGKATINNSDTPLVKQSRVLYTKKESQKAGNFFMSPLMIFGIISLLIILITYSDYKKNTRTVWLDVVIFSITGITGIFLLLLWFATDHSATAYNYNMLWAFPLNIILISQVFKKVPKRWFIKYLKFLLIMMCLLTLHWIIGVQVFAISLLPILIALVIRYVYLLKDFKRKLT